MAATVPVVAAASIDQRFAQLIQQFGLTKNSFAISLGKTASVVQHLIDGRNKPGFDLMCKVFEVYPNVSRDWLLLGRGPMLVGSNGVSGPAIAAAQPAVPEPDFEPIDLADVAPRAARRPTVSRLQPEEIAATLALATAAADGSAPTITTAPSPALPPAHEPATPAAHATSVAAAAEPMLVAEATAPVPSRPVAAAATQRPMRPFRAASVPAAPVVAPPRVPEVPAAAPVAAEPAPAAATMPELPAAPTPAAPAVAVQPVAAAGNPEAYVAAAIHAQHLQHQLALAELRNQHLLEQQQMLREMLAMARQSMV